MSTPAGELPAGRSASERPGVPGRGPTGPTGRGAKTRNVARRELDPARLAAWQTLRAVDAEDSYANLVLPRLLRQAGLRGRDAAFATELAYGALRGRGTYDAVLAACVDRPLGDVDPPLLDALRLGAHQVLGMRVPVHAAVAATVDLVRAEIGQGAAGYANAVLRRVSGRALDDWLGELAPDPGSGPGADASLAVRTSHPGWIIRALRDALAVHGRDAGELVDLLMADNARPSVTLAVLPGLAEVGDVIANSAGAALTELSPYAVRVSGAPGDIPLVRSGRARVQDEGSQLVALALAYAPLQGADAGRWLDLCAGPGGKAALLAAVLRTRRTAGVLGADATLVANEVSAHRLELVRTAVARLGDVVELTKGDGAVPDPQAGRPGSPAGFDRVLVDVPCTGLGALRRRPEARWRRTAADLAPLGVLQRALLTAGLARVRPGGVVAYTTCSPHPAETVAVVADVLKRDPRVHRLDARAAIDAAVGRELRDLGAGPDVQLWQHVHGTDGMFLALLRRDR